MSLKHLEEPKPIVTDTIPTPATTDEIFTPLTCKIITTNISNTA